MIESIPPNKDETVGGMVAIAFITLIVLLILGILWVNENSFWGQTYAVGLFAAIISHIVLLSKIRNKLLNNIK